MTDHDGADFSDARFTGADFSNARFRDCDLRGVRITDSWLIDIAISGLLGRTVVNDVDVTAYVEAELDRRSPERLQARLAETPDELRAAWRLIMDSWDETVARSRPGALWSQRVDGEWSLVETLRHLIFATDAWLSGPVLDEPAPFHPLGLPHSSHPPEAAAALGIDPEVAPDLDEVLAVRAERTALMTEVLAGLTAAEAERICLRPPAPGYPEEPRTVRQCLKVVLEEEAEHLRYARRDLAALEAAG